MTMAMATTPRKCWGTHLHVSACSTLCLFSVLTAHALQMSFILTLNSGKMVFFCKKCVVTVYVSEKLAFCYCCCSMWWFLKGANRVCSNSTKKRLETKFIWMHGKSPNWRKIELISKFSHCVCVCIYFFCIHHCRWDVRFIYSQLSFWSIGFHFKFILPAFQMQNSFQNDEEWWEWENEMGFLYATTHIAYWIVW